MNIQGAELLAAGKILGLSIDDTLALKAQIDASNGKSMAPERSTQMLRRRHELRDNRSRRGGASVEGEFDEKIAKEIEGRLFAENLGMDASDMKSDRQMVKEVGEIWGYNDFERYASGQEGQIKYGADGRNPYEIRQEDEASIMSREDQRERGMYIRDQKSGERKWLQRGELYETPEKAPQRTITGVRGSTNEELQRLKVQDSASGQSARIENERRSRGQLTEQEMQGMARLLAGRGGSDPIKSSVPVPIPDSVPRPETPSGTRTYTDPYGNKETFPIPRPDVEDWYREPPSGMADKVEFDIRRQAPVSAHAGVTPRVSPEESQDAILAQLRARKERGGAVNDSRRQGNFTEAAYEADQLGRDGQRIARAESVLRGLPAVNNLGKAYLGGATVVNDGNFGPQQMSYQAGSDLGVQLGNQRVSLGDAVMNRRADGSIDYYDSTKTDILGNQEFDNRPIAPVVGTSAEALNAPLVQETAQSFIEKNMYDSYGAQNFGDESILANLNEKGSGGGIQQVDIRGTLGNLEMQVAQRLGVPVKGIRSAASLQAAMDAVNANSVGRGNKLNRLVNNQNVTTGLAGMDEAFMALGITPADQKEIANAIGQLELARGQNVNLGGKESFFGGGRAAQTAWDGKAIITGVNDPAKGGDRLEFAKDVQFANKLKAAGKEGDAVYPFIALNQEDVDARKAAVAAYQQETNSKRRPPRTPEENLQRWKGKDPVEARVYQEGIDRRNRKGKALPNSKGMTGLSPQEALEISKIRGMQEGNVLAGLRLQMARAQERAQPFNLGGRIMSGTPVPENLQGTVQQRPASVTERTVASNQVLRQRPAWTSPDAGGRRVDLEVRRPMSGASKPQSNDPEILLKQEKAKRRRPSNEINSNPTVVEGPNIELPTGFGGHPVTETNRQAGPVMRDGPRTREQRVDQMKNIARRVSPTFSRRNAIGYGSAAALAGILGLSGDDEEDRQEQY